MKIFKYEVPIQDNFEIEMPKGAQILSFQVQDRKPCIWVVVDEQSPLIQNYFNLCGTGDTINTFATGFIDYVGTIQLDGFVWHLFKS